MPKPKKRLSLERKNSLMGYVYMTPVIFGLLALFLPNMFDTVKSTFFSVTFENGAAVYDPVGLDNYVRALTGDIRFKTYLLETLSTLVTQIPVIVIFSLFLSAVLNQDFRGRTLARTVFFLPVIVATGILLIVDTGSAAIGNNISLETARNSAAESADLMAGIMEMLSGFGLGEGIIAVVVAAADGIYQVVLASGIQIFIFLAALQEVPHSLYEAAKVEGCDGWQNFWKITFPMITPQIIVCLVYTAVDTLTKSGSPLDVYIQEVTQGGRQFGYSITMSLLYFCAVAAVMGVCALFIRGLIRSR